MLLKGTTTCDGLIPAMKMGLLAVDRLTELIPAVGEHRVANVGKAELISREEGTIDEGIVENSKESLCP